MSEPRKISIPATPAYRSRWVANQCVSISYNSSKQLCVTSRQSRSTPGAFTRVFLTPNSCYRVTVTGQAIGQSCAFVFVYDPVSRKRLIPNYTLLPTSCVGCADATFVTPRSHKNTVCLLIGVLLTKPKNGQSFCIQEVRLDKGDTPHHPHQPSCLYNGAGSIPIQYTPHVTAYGQTEASNHYVVSPRPSRPVSPVPDQVYAHHPTHSPTRYAANDEHVSPPTPNPGAIVEEETHHHHHMQALNDPYYTYDPTESLPPASHYATSGPTATPSYKHAHAHSNTTLPASSHPAVCPVVSSHHKTPKCNSKQDSSLHVASQASNENYSQSAPVLSIKDLQDSLSNMISGMK